MPRQKEQIPKASDVLGQVTEGERAVKDLLHAGVVGGKAKLPVKWLAAATGYTDFSIYKAVDRQTINGLPFRVVDGAALGSRAIGAELLALLRERWQRTVAPSTLRGVLEQDAAAQQASTEARCLQFAALHDGLVTADELAEMETAWNRERHEREAQQEQIRALARDGRRLKEVSSS